MSNLRIFKLALLWRLALFAISIWVSDNITFTDSFPYRAERLVPYAPQWLYSWANFDGVHYIGISLSGYSAQFTQAFFPLFPRLIRFLDVLNNPLITGLVIGNIFLFLATWIFYKYLLIDNSVKTATTALLLLLLFPTSFFLGGLYTESIFLFLSISVFYTARKKHWLTASLLTAIATNTRLVGIFLLPALIVERYQSLKTKKQKNNPKNYLSLLIAPLGLLLYMLFLQINYSDPFYFASVQSAFGASRTTTEFIPIFQVIYRYIKMLLTVPILSLTYLTVIQEFSLSIIFGGLLYLVYKQRPLSEFVYCLLSFTLPTLTGTFSSMPRYMLVLFPCFIVSAFLLEKYKIKPLIFVISTILLIINTGLFLSGHWVA